jgi:hypothetical protein
MHRVSDCATGATVPVAWTSSNLLWLSDKPSQNLSQAWHVYVSIEHPSRASKKQYLTLKKGAPSGGAFLLRFFGSGVRAALEAQHLARLVRGGGLAVGELHDLYRFFYLLV